MKKRKKKSFWLSVWRKPEQTFRRSNKEIDQRAWLVLILLSFSIALTIFSGLGYYGRVDKYSWKTVLLAIGIGVLGSASYVYLGGYIFSKVGVWIYGVAKPKEVRTAIILSAVPPIIAIPFWLPATFSMWFQYNNIHVSNLLLVFLVLISIPCKYIANFLYIFSFTVLIRVLATVHRFSKWDAIFTFFIGNMLIAIPFIIYLLIW